MTEEPSSGEPAEPSEPVEPETAQVPTEEPMETLSVSLTKKKGEIVTTIKTLNCLLYGYIALNICSAPKFL